MASQEEIVRPRSRELAAVLARGRQLGQVLAQESARVPEQARESLLVRRLDPEQVWRLVPVSV